MLNNADLILVLMVYVAPVIFVVWGVVAHVKAQRKIATALELLAIRFGSEDTASGPKLRSKSEDPAYKYIPK